MFQTKKRKKYKIMWQCITLAHFIIFYANMIYVQWYKAEKNARMCLYFFFVSYFFFFFWKTYFFCECEHFLFPIVLMRVELEIPFFVNFYICFVVTSWDLFISWECSHLELKYYFANLNIYICFSKENCDKYKIF